MPSSSILRIIPIVATIMLCIILVRGQIYAQPEKDTVMITKSTSLFLDGSVKNLQASGSKTTDLVSTGTVGFRVDNELTLFQISISAYSSLDTILSSGSDAYAQSVLNTGITRSGLKSISAKFGRRFFATRGYQKYLVDILRSSNDDITLNEYFGILTRNDLNNVDWIWRHLGWNLYMEASSLVWEDTSKNFFNGTVVSLGGGFTYFNKFIKNQSVDIDLTLGFGLTSRFIAGDLSADVQTDFRKKLISTSKNVFFGPEFSGEIRVNNLYAKIDIPIITNESYIPSLTQGQFYFQVGVSVDVGQKQTEKVSLKDIDDYGEDVFK